MAKTVIGYCNCRYHHFPGRVRNIFPRIVRCNVANAIAEDWKKDEGKRAGIETESLSVLVSCEKSIRTIPGWWFGTFCYVSIYWEQ